MTKILVVVFCVNGYCDTHRIPVPAAHCEREAINATWRGARSAYCR
jgi:hypothetical protein